MVAMFVSALVVVTIFFGVLPVFDRGLQGPPELLGFAVGVTGLLTFFALLGVGIWIRERNAT
ncbi:hypothetical protein NGM10_05435 [Halorussus salilacus]|uniref:hypothetical protein n=1 Tax=Halorussus salilacus TaxID=2953750 RepID=UPI00209FE3E6|nr:hypothetical protein [Halorussus salilacus]USZ69182.1 hypothetical protein NGM10_05435 [Halorussus salilacus]